MPSERIELTCCVLSAVPLSVGVRRQLGGAEGIEPSTAVPKTAVMPFHYTPTFFKNIRIIRVRWRSSVAHLASHGRNRNRTCLLTPRGYSPLPYHYGSPPETASHRPCRKVTEENRTPVSSSTDCRLNHSATATHFAAFPDGAPRNICTQGRRESNPVLKVLETSAFPSGPAPTISLRPFSSQCKGIFAAKSGPVCCQTGPLHAAHYRAEITLNQGLNRFRVCPPRCQLRRR